MIILLTMSSIVYKITVCNMLHVDDGCDFCRSSVRLNNRIKEFIIIRPLGLQPLDSHAIINHYASFGYFSFIYNIIIL